VHERVILKDPDSAARWAAGRMAGWLAEAIEARGSASLAVSGGRSPWVMMADLFRRDLPWQCVDILQVDERVAPDGDDIRNMSRIGPLIMGSPAERARVHPMQVGDGADAAVDDYRELLGGLGGPIDVVQLGLGDDGHTASLVPGDPVLDITDALVAATAARYRGTTRVTLTYPAINAARHVLWLITGSGKREMVRLLEDGDTGIPAGRVSAPAQVLVVDRAAATD
jgi:6-phosphogluconolactonase